MFLKIFGRKFGLFSFFRIWSFWNCLWPNLAFLIFLDLATLVFGLHLSACKVYFFNVVNNEFICYALYFRCFSCDGLVPKWSSFWRFKSIRRSPNWKQTWFKRAFASEPWARPTSWSWKAKPVRDFKVLPVLLIFQWWYHSARFDIFYEENYSFPKYNPESVSPIRVGRFESIKLFVYCNSV